VLFPNSSAAFTVTVCSGAVVTQARFFRPLVARSRPDAVTLPKPPPRGFLFSFARHLESSPAPFNPKQSSTQMAVPGGRNGLRDDEDDIAEHAEVFAGASDDEDVPPHLRALANAAQTGDVDALRAALGTGLIRPIRLRSSFAGTLLGLGGIT